MDTIIEDKIRDLEERIEKVKLCNDDLIIAREILPEGASYWIDYEVNVNWAVKSMDEVKAVLKDFAKKGIMIDLFRESDTNPTWKLKGSKAGIRLSPIWSKEEGAVCRLVKVGEETIVNPIYKLVCDKEAQDHGKS